MRRILAATAFTAMATSAFALAMSQARINFTNHTTEPTRFSVDGTPACTGEVAPNRSCTEFVSAPETHTLTAAAPGRAAVSHTLNVREGDVKNWTVSTQN